MEKIAIFPNLDKDPKLEYTKETAKEIRKFGKTVLLSDKFSYANIEGAEYLPEESFFEKADLIVALGGDGTVLNATKNAAKFLIPVMGINIGHLGFLTQAEKNDKSVFEDVFSGNYEIMESMMLEVSVCSGNEEIESFIAFNDAVIRGADSKMVTLRTSVDGTVMSEYTADGVIFSTPTGSTAYSMSAGGPVIHPSLSCILAVPVCPHSLTVRSIVLPSTSEIMAEALPPYRCEAVLTVDGKKVRVLGKSESVKIRASSVHTKLLRITNRNFFDNIREKLNFR